MRVGNRLSDDGRTSLGAAGCALALVAVVATVALSDVARAEESFDDALLKAYNSNPTLQAARAELRAVNEFVPQALSNWRPGVDLTANTAVGKTDTRGDGGGQEKEFKTFGSYGAQVSITQFLFRGGRTVSETRLARATVDAQRALLTATEQAVLFGAATAFVDVWRDQNIVDANEQNVSRLREQLDGAQQRFELRQVTRTDVSQAESRLARGRADLAGAERTLATSRATYKQVVGNMPDLLAMPPSADGLPQSLEETIALATANNPQVAAAAFLEEAGLHNVRFQFGSLLPEVSIVGSLSHNEQTLGDFEVRNDARVVGQLRVPLYERGLVSSRVREAKERRNQARLQVEEARRAAEQFAIDSWEALYAARDQIDAYEAEVQATLDALNGIQDEAGAGVRTILDVLDAEQEYTDAQINRAVAQRDEALAGYQMLQAIGQLTAESLGLGEELYDPAADFEEVEDQWYGFGGVPYLSDEW